MSHKFAIQVFNLLDLSQSHSILPKDILTTMFDILNSPHRLNGLDVQITVVHQRFIATLLKVKDGVICELFSVSLAVCFGPCYLSWIVLCFEMAMALRSTESKHFAVVTHEAYAMAGIYWSRTKVTLLNSHFNNPKKYNVRCKWLI
jgi:hypothetical protein